MTSKALINVRFYCAGHSTNNIIRDKLISLFSGLSELISITWKDSLNIIGFQWRTAYEWRILTLFQRNHKPFQKYQKEGQDNMTLPWGRKAAFGEMGDMGSPSCQVWVRGSVQTGRLECSIRQIFGNRNIKVPSDIFLFLHIIFFSLLVHKLHWTQKILPWRKV